MEDDYEKASSFFFLLSSFFFLLSSFLVNTCTQEAQFSEPQNIDRETPKSSVLLAKKGNVKKKNIWPATIIDSVYGTVTVDYDYQPIQTRAAECGVMTIYGYITDHFEPKPGKLIGICPYEYTQAKLEEYRTKWGYTGIYANTNQYQIAIDAGYDKSNIMLSCSFNTGTSDYINIINNYDAGMYYIGEAVEHGCTGNGDKRLYWDYEIDAVGNYIHNNRPYSKFVSDGYKRCRHFDYLAKHVDLIMFSSYAHWERYNIQFCNPNMPWLPGMEDIWYDIDDDQRSDWTELKNVYKTRFMQSWINTYEVAEYDLLFGHAQNLGLEAIWIYGATNHGVPVPHYNDKFEEISTAAFNHGFLRKFVQPVIIEWRCEFGCDCDPTNPDDWYVYKVTPFGGVYEIYP